jgi:hypothetical protein
MNNLESLALKTYLEKLINANELRYTKEFLNAIKVYKEILGKDKGCIKLYLIIADCYFE